MWVVVGESRWERALRAMNLGEEDMNLHINLLPAVGSLDTEERNCWPCLLREH